MTDTSVLLAALIATGVLTAAAGPITRVVGDRAGWVLAVALTAVAAAFGLLAPDVVAGQEVVWETPWLAALGISFALRLDALSLLFALLVLVFGALVLAYCPAYLRGHVQRQARFYTLMVGFTAAMLGLTLADDVWLFYAFWELTTVASFLLIGHGGAQPDRRAATRAFVVTFAGGLALLAGLLLAASSAGTYRISELTGGALAPGAGTTGAVLALVVAGAAAKSAQWPLHVWLPDAMGAPTPVSAYLHSAAMVKAGPFVLARMSPLVEGQSWSGVVVLLGLVTAVFGAAVALRRTDLKEILAYSTVGQLGLIVALLGVGRFAAVAAALLHVLAHATYKAPLFLLAGAIEEATGRRDIRELHGLRRSMPVLTGATTLAVASMAGLPPLLGFVSKEEALAVLFEDLSGGLRVVAVGLAIAAVTLTVAYALRILLALVPGRRATGERPAASLVAVPLALTVAALVGGLWSGRLGTPIAAAARAALGHGEALELGLWHGATMAFWSSLLATAAGVVIVVAVRARDSVRDPRPLSGSRRLQSALEGLATIGDRLGHPLGRAVPAWHLGAITAVAAAVTTTVWVRVGTGRSPAWSPPAEEWAILVLLALAVAATITARNRMAAVAVLAAVDFLVVAIYVLHGAPDLALTQLIVDALTVALIVLVFRQLPPSYPEGTTRRRVVSAAVAVVAGAGVGLAAYVLPSGERSPLASFYLETAPEEGGRNVVNTILTDFRALDTLGEITVIAVAALGAVTLIRAAGGRS